MEDVCKASLPTQGSRQGRILIQDDYDDDVHTFKFLQRLEVWIQMKSSISLKKKRRQFAHLM